MVSLKGIPGFIPTFPRSSKSIPSCSVTLVESWNPFWGFDDLREKEYHNWVKVSNLKQELDQAKDLNGELVLLELTIKQAC